MYHSTLGLRAVKKKKKKKKKKKEKTVSRGNAKTLIDSGLGTTRAEDAPGTPTQSHISPSILVDEYYL